MDNEQSEKMENNPSNPEKESTPQPGNNVAATTETTEAQSRVPFWLPEGWLPVSRKSRLPPA